MRKTACLYFQQGWGRPGRRGALPETGTVRTDILEHVSDKVQGTFVLRFIFPSNNFLKSTVSSPFYRLSGVNGSSKDTEGGDPSLGPLDAARQCSQDHPEPVLGFMQ